MAEPTTSDGGKFDELFKVIAKYSQRDRDYQEKALRVIAGAYDAPLEPEPLPEIKQVVDDILGQHDWVFTIDESGHTLDPHSIDAVVRVALYSEENREWGINRLSRMLEGLVRKLSSIEEDYDGYEGDSDIVITGLRAIIAGALVEEIAEDLEEIAGEDALGNGA